MWYQLITVGVSAATDPTTPPTTEVAPIDQPLSGQQVVNSVSDVVSAVFDNLSNNGYQTGIALVTATIALVAMLNLAVHKAILAPVAIGAFWAGWLGWNTFTGQDNLLFPGDVSSTKLWDVAFTSDTGFLLVVAVACVAAIFLWRKSTALAGRIMLLVGAVLGASFVYNLVEAFRYG